MQAVAFERSTLYGIVVNPKKRVNYGPMNPAEARELFIRQGLVGNQHQIRSQHLPRFHFQRPPDAVSQKPHCRNRSHRHAQRKKQQP